MSSSDSENGKSIKRIDAKSADYEEEEEDIFGAEDLFSDGSYDEESEAKEVKLKNEKPVKSKTTEKNDKIKKNVAPRKTAKINFTRLNGESGLRLLKKSFNNFQFKGENHEKEDLARIIQMMKHWMCYQFFPKYSFQDTVAELEHLGNKKEVQVLLKKMRLGMDEWGQQNIQLPEQKDLFNDILDDDGISRENNFESWWNQEMTKDSNDTNLGEIPQAIGEGNIEQKNEKKSNDPPQIQSQITLTPEQLERIARNKKLAEERKLQRLARDIADPSTAKDSNCKNN